MKPKQIVTAVLLLFVAASVVALALRETRGKSPSDDTASSAASPATMAVETDADAATVKAAAAPSDDPAPSDDAEKVIVYYFHGNKRCATCLKIESLAGAAVAEHFASLLDDKSLEWKVVNADEPENEHFIEDYQLSTKSIVLSRLRDGKEVEWKNLDRVWELIRNEGEFQSYIIREVENFVAGNGTPTS